ncbi:MAG TPA: hypothetical protein VGB98_18005 [Pyrinomonadaceae bacterium]|jgi:hypothetical protein
MRALSSSELLEVWERGRAAAPVGRALLLLEAAAPEAEPDALARMPVGRRDASLLSLRELTFGPRLVSSVNCAGCGERLELAFDASDVRAGPGPRSGDVFKSSVGDYEVSFRLPNSLDLLDLTSCAGPSEARLRLFERCVGSVVLGGSEVEPKSLPAEVVAGVSERMSQADPQGDVRVSVNCPACGGEWQALFDIVSFFWSEVEASARRTLQEVHLLASAYGWREADVLALSPQRRRLYLEMIRG